MYPSLDLQKSCLMLEHISGYNALSKSPLYKILTLKECKWELCLEYAAHRFCEIVFRV